MQGSGLRLSLLIHHASWANSPTFFFFGLLSSLVMGTPYSLGFFSPIGYSISISSTLTDLVTIHILMISTFLCLTKLSLLVSTRSGILQEVPLSKSTTNCIIFSPKPICSYPQSFSDPRSQARNQAIFSLSAPILS